MTQPAVPDVADSVIGGTWWKSKKLIIVLAHHVTVLITAITGTIMSHGTAGPTLMAAAIGAISTVTLGHTVAQTSIDHAQVTSPNYPTPVPVIVQPGATYVHSGPPTAPVIVPTPPVAEPLPHITLPH